MEIEVITAGSRIEGDVVLEMKECICECIDKNKRYLLIDMQGKEYMSKQGIDVLKLAINRGLCVRLFNVRSESLSILAMNGNEMLKGIVYETNDIKGAINSFQIEIKSIKNEKEPMIIGRKHRRAEVFLLVQFSWLNENNELISGKAQIIDLSEGGMLTYKMIAINVNEGGAVEPEKIIQKNCFPMAFNLYKGEPPIVIVGEIVRIIRIDETLSVGMRFMEISGKGRDRIKEYVRKKTKTTVKIVNRYHV